MSEWLLLQSNATIYGVLFTLLITGSLGFPPEDFTLLLAGIVYHSGKGDVRTLFLLGYVGTVLGDLFIYSVGRKFGNKIFNRPWIKSRFRPAKIKLVKKGLEKQSLPTIFVARHLFYLRTLTFLTCGAVKMKFTRFLIADCLSALASVPLMLWLGFQASENYDTVYNYIKDAKLFSLVVAIIIAGAIGAYLYRLREIVEPESSVSLDTVSQSTPVESIENESKVEELKK